MKFRLGGNTHTFTLLEFARALGLYNREEFADRHFKYYFKSRVHDDSQFREEEYWVSVSSEDSVRLSRTCADLYRPQGTKSSASSSVNNDALARLMVTEMGAQEKEERLAFLEIKRREVECRERELEQQDMRFYLQSYDHLVGDQRKLIQLPHIPTLTKASLTTYSPPLACKKLDATTFRELIGADAQLVPAACVARRPIS
ncbi:hypothetical protein Tco_1126289, partial [Tanacetum coccineum]